MAIEKTSRPFTVKALHKRFKRGELNFDLAIQRNADIWSADKKSLLIHSCIYGYPIPPFYCVEQDSSLYNFIDGKQRLTNLFQFLDGEFSLSDNTPLVDDMDISGLTFEQLPEDYQEEILDTYLSITFLKNITEEEIEEVFFRLNNGVSLTKIELIRSKASGMVMDFINQLTDSPFFKKSLNLTVTQRKRYVDQEIVLQILSLLLYNTDRGFSGNELMELAEELKENGINDTTKDMIYEVTDYLSQAFPHKNKFLRKTNIAALFIIAQRAMMQDVKQSQFGGWAQQFFNNLKPGCDYNDTTRSGSAKANKIRKRLEILNNNFDNNIMTAKEYEKPKTGRKSRKVV